MDRMRLVRSAPPGTAAIGREPLAGRRHRLTLIVDPRFPAAVNTYMPTALTVAESVLMALAPFVPDRRIAGG